MDKKANERHSVRLKEVSVKEDEVGDTYTKIEYDLDRQANERRSVRLKEVSVNEEEVGDA